ncbi:MAG TPA: uroporphyrinogen decarboxylase [Thermopetrobacter sp.]|nr:uroporphyrinogen decarboxylase [Thermopetrobacter sp.]
MNFNESETENRKALLEVLDGRVPWRRPVWFMRQAGRYLPEYRQTRARAGSFLDLCYDPVLATEVTLQPLKRFDVDAAILFADILLLPQAMGAQLSFRQNEGPVLDVVDDAAAVRRLDADGAAARLTPVYETVAKLAAALPGHVALIGFCGAPWTVASYMVEGGGSAERLKARLAAMRAEPWLDALIDKIVAASIDYLERQVRAGAEAVQIFDTWAGDFGDGLREKYVFAPIARIVEGLKARGVEVPVIGFARGVGAAQEAFARATGVRAVGCETPMPVAAMRSLSDAVVVQGNLDPLLVMAGGAAMENAVRRLLALPKARHIFNLGHGFRPQTPVSHVERVMELVREE